MSFLRPATSDLKPESAAELDKLAELLDKNPLLKIQINGHTDNVGNDDSNTLLSEKGQRQFMITLSPGRFIRNDFVSGVLVKQSRLNPTILRKAAPGTEEPNLKSGNLTPYHDQEIYLH
jgi:hypothetical protein